MSARTSINVPRPLIDPTGVESKQENVCLSLLYSKDEEEREEDEEEEEEEEEKKYNPSHFFPLLLKLERLASSVEIISMDNGERGVNNFYGVRPTNSLEKFDIGISKEIPGIFHSPKPYASRASYRSIDVDGDGGGSGDDGGSDDGDSTMGSWKRAEGG
ncbi:hypothetical protein V1477_005320 [Vespula maculifrons]|uniref:Uncharacterized protein n=1 Tax=Vespula maculifrons TaxID=7453 RepID=A0ABD2CQH1_VESMC